MKRKLTPDERKGICLDHLQMFKNDILNEEEQHEYKRLQTIQQALSGAFAVAIPLAMVNVFSLKYGCNSVGYYIKWCQGHLFTQTTRTKRMMTPIIHTTKETREAQNGDFNSVKLNITQAISNSFLPASSLLLLLFVFSFPFPAQQSKSYFN